MQIGNVDAFILHTYSRETHSSGRLKATQRVLSHPGVGLNRRHCESYGSPQDPLPKK